MKLFILYNTRTCISKLPKAYYCLRFADLRVDAHNKYSNDLVLFLSSFFRTLSANRKIISIRYIFSKINHLIRNLDPQASTNRATKMKERITTNKKVLHGWSRVCERSRLLAALIGQKNLYQDNRWNSLQLADRIASIAWKFDFFARFSPIAGRSCVKEEICLGRSWRDCLSVTPGTAARVRFSSPVFPLQKPYRRNSERQTRRSIDTLTTDSLLAGAFYRDKASN